jgi:hypothetical protein
MYNLVISTAMFLSDYTSILRDRFVGGEDKSTTLFISSDVTPEHADTETEATARSFAKEAHALTVNSRAVYDEDFSAKAY